MQCLDVTDFILVLKALGFKHDPLDHKILAEEPSDCETDIWKLECQGSEMWDGMPKIVTVQLWSDGKHRVSHMKSTDGSMLRMKGHKPTSFLTPGEMVWAIQKQMEERSDNN